MIRIVAAAAFALAAAPAPAEEVRYEVGGETFVGWFEGVDAPRGLVLIVHDWDGLTDYEKRRAGMLAEMGYDAFAVDLFGPDTPTETMEHRRAATGALYGDRARMRALLEGGLVAARVASTAESVVAMGYCFGGAAVLEMARGGLGDDVEGYATFHGGLSTPEGQGYSSDTPPILVMHGGADSSITMDDVAALSRELEGAETTYEIQVYSGAPHAFTVFGSDRYQERADIESWEAFSDFLETRLGG
ncbi:MAG TPA: dienelactone hydrolase family protein [Paracoccaceae bacterium]|nr:dienelactone hydrolase family protein [Paracoccaceae bacterium]